MRGLISGALVAVALLVTSGETAKADHCQSYGGYSYNNFAPSYGYSYQPSYQPSYYGSYSPNYYYSRPSYGLGYSSPGFSISIGRGLSFGSGYSRGYGYGSSFGHHRHHRH